MDYSKRGSLVQVAPDGETPREWAHYVLNLVQQRDPAAFLCLDGDEWLVETALHSPTAAAFMGVALVPAGYSACYRSIPGRTQ